jgi:chromosome partitioning protein
MAKRVSIINFKGGVGKTTLAFHLATGLARFFGQKKVLLVDVDHQSSLSVLCAGAIGWERVVDLNQTVDNVFRHFVDGNNPFPEDEIIDHHPKTKIWYRQAAGYHCWEPVFLRSRYPTLDLLPASLSLDDTEIELTGTYRGDGDRSEWDKRTLLCRWIEEAEIEGETIDEYYDYIIFDCPPATKIISQNAIAASHGYIVPVVPEAVMARGVPHLRSLISNGIDGRLNNLSQSGSPRPIYVNDTQLVGIVISSIKKHGAAYSGYTNDHTQHLRILERNLGNLLVTPYIEEGVGVSESLTQGLPVFDCLQNRNVQDRGFSPMYSELVRNLKSRVDAL